MKKTKLLLSILLALIFTTGMVYAQKQNFPSKPKDGQSGMVDTRIDNMRYWGKMAEQGLVKVAPAIPVAPAIYTGSNIDATTVAKDDSPDVPVTDQTNTTQSENSAFIDPSDPEFLLNSNNSTSWSGGSIGTLYGANYFYSGDAGLTWGGSPQGPGGGNSGDPATAINLDGTRMYVEYITNPGGQGVSYSTDGGSTWTPVVIAPNPGSLADKNHMWIDNSPISPYEGQLYTAWTPFGGGNDSEIVISRTTNEGLSWSSPVNISSAVNAGGHNQGVNIQTGPNGEVYACWAIYDGWPADEGAIGFAKSTDGGATYEPAVRIIDDIRGIRTSETSKNHRVNSFPVMAVDISNGSYSGNIYVTWTNIGVPGVNTGSDIDVYMIRSEDDGDTWSAPIRINQDPTGLGNEHYFPWITCDPESGILSAIFYDDRNVGGSQCEVYCANSFDGGETWEDFKVSDVSFTPSAIPGLAGGYMGDYLSITARGSLVYPVWTDNRNGLYMTYVSPYVTNNLPKPTDLVITLDDETGGIDLEWQYAGEDFLFFNVYRDGTLLGTTTDLTYSDNLPDYGVFSYGVTAMHDDGESVAAGGSIQWGDAHISVTPLEFVQNLVPEATAEQTMTIENVGELELEYSIQPEITSKKTKDYCSASGGCDEFLAQVIFGTIDNTSGCDGYADYTSMSTILNSGESYDITIVNGNSYSSDDIGIWIDWNQDQDFEDADENVVCEVNNGGEGTFTITVPPGALPGDTRMRIRMKWSGDDCGDPCGTTSYGEVEDYTVSVLGWLLVSPLAGTLAPGESDEITLAFSAVDMAVGTYTANLHVSSNDPDLNMVSAAVTLNVGEDIPEVTAGADPAVVCEGESTQLTANPSGGSGTYSYEWTSEPAGFTSTDQNPMAAPLETTKYIVDVYDGVFHVMDSITVNVSLLPEMSATPTGTTEMCQGSENTTYETTGSANALSYMWVLTPETAGTVSGNGTVGIVNWNDEFSGPVDVTVYGVNDCGDGISSEALTVTINALPVVTAELIDTVNYYVEPFELTGGLPLGGTYSGDGVTDGWFDPEAAGLGSHTITYTYFDANSCENFAEAVIVVDEVAGINDFAEGINFGIYPNPNKGVFTLSVNSIENTSFSLRIINALGVEVYNEADVSLNKEYKNTIDLSSYEEGLYFVNIIYNDRNYIRKIVVTN
jgi:hypothetical protein